MPARAQLNYLRIAPRKLRLVADMIRRKKVDQARTILRFTIKKGAKPLLKLLESAVANAKNNLQMDDKDLYISRLLVNEGPKLKRLMPRARGQGFPIKKRTSHIFLELESLDGSKTPKPEKISQGPKAQEEVLLDDKDGNAEKDQKKPGFKQEEKFSGKKIKRGKQVNLPRIFRRKAM